MVEKNNFDLFYYEEKESIKTLLESERKFYLNYFKSAYKEDFKHSQDTLFSSSKWSIIAGYYAMHNISKYYLGLKFNKKISLSDIHNVTIIAIKEYVKNSEIKNLIKEIEDFSEVTPLYLGLVKGKQERAKTQYYTNETNSTKKISLERANYFFNNIVEKYIKLMEGLIEKC